MGPSLHERAGSREVAMSVSTIVAGPDLEEGNGPGDVRETELPLSVVLFSGTDDRLEAAAVLIAGAVAMGRRVEVLVQYWALEAFRADRITQDHGLAPEASAEGGRRLRLMAVRPGHQHWSEVLRQVKELGELSIHACALSMDAFGLGADQLDPLVDGVEGVAAFLAGATGPVTFI
jgi:peroxiredoxin family protein